jgi:hypothetical protein
MVQSDLAVYRRTLLAKIGFLRPGFDGAELHDLASRATAVIAPGKIRHIPSILYHRRQKTSQPTEPVAELSGTASGRAVRDHLDAQGNKEAVLESVPQFQRAIRVKWPLPKDPPLASVIAPTRAGGSCGKMRRWSAPSGRLFQSGVIDPHNTAPNQLH